MVSIMGKQHALGLVMFGFFPQKGGLKMIEVLTKCWDVEVKSGSKTAGGDKVKKIFVFRGDLFTFDRFTMSYCLTYSFPWLSSETDAPRLVENGHPSSLLRDVRLDSLEANSLRLNCEDLRAFPSSGA